MVKMMQDADLEHITVHTRAMNLSLQQLKNSVDANDIITDPDYQRKYVYDDKRASCLIESILIGIPIPVIYLAEEEDGVYSVIDGQQRITSFVRYLKNEFPLVGLKRLQSLNGLYFKQLDKAVQRRLNYQTLSTVCIEKDSQNLKYEIFSRLNLGAVKLRDQEVRNCIYRGSFNDMLKEIANTNIYLPVLFHDTNTRYSYEERILRFFTLRPMKLKGTFKVMMNNYMETHANDEEEVLKKYKAQYNSLIELVKTVLGEDAFFASDQRKKFNGAVYDSIMIPFSLFAKKDIIRHADEIRNAIQKLKSENKDYQDWVFAGTNASARICSRVHAVTDVLNQIIHPFQSNTEYSQRCFSANVKKNLFYPGYICKYCGNQILSIDDCEVDHIIPFDMGGPTTLENAQLLHKWCNRSKGNTLQIELDFEDNSEEDTDSDSSITP